MRIGPKHTVNDVMIQGRPLFEMALDKVIEEVKKFDVPTSLPLSRPALKRHLKQKDGEEKKPTRGVTSRVRLRTVDDLMMIELKLLTENIVLDYDYFFRVFRIICGLKAGRVKRLPFIDAYRFFLEVDERLPKIIEAFNDLAIPLSEKEKKAIVRSKSLGLFDLIQDFVAQFPQYTHKEAWHLNWQIIYQAFKKEKNRVLTMRNFEKMNQNQTVKGKR